MDLRKDINLLKYDEAFITGCDNTQEWMLDWFITNYKKWNVTPIVFADFGVSESMLSKIKKEKKFSAVINLTKIQEQGWFKKPKAMLNSPSEKTIWLDTDCEVLGNIDKMFNRLKLNKLSMVCDYPWTKRRKEAWYNSGVVGFIDKPKILYDWAKQVKETPNVGDQEVLHRMTDPMQKLIFIDELPNKFNVTRIQFLDKTVPKDAKIFHWTGRKGKEVLQKRMNGTNVFL